MKRFLAAIRFLTIVPISGTWGTSPAELAGSVPFFPAVGLLLGGVAAAMAFGLVHLAPPLLAAAGLTVALLAFSGGLHLDGLSDTADGFFSARPRERILEIMKDSHVGAMGVLAIVGVLLLKFAALAELAGHVAQASHVAQPPSAGVFLLIGGSAWFWAAALLAPLAGRTAIVVQIALLRYARPEGLGKVFCAGRAWWSALWSIAVLTGVGVFVLGLAGLAVAAACVVVAAGFAGYCRRKIGGATGDTFGAACELGELAAVVTLAVWSSWA